MKKYTNIVFFCLVCFHANATEENSIINDNPHSNIERASVELSTEKNGFDIAASINQRFNSIVEDCDGRSAYYCSGVVIRGNENFDIPTWVPQGQGAVLQILPASFIRVDINDAVNSIWGVGNVPFGIILMPANLKEYSTRCFYPSDGQSYYSTDNGCGGLASSENKIIFEDNSDCNSKDVFTAEQWVDLTGEYLNGASTKPYCSFSSLKPHEFNEALKAQNLYHDKWCGDKSPCIINELVINSAPENWDVTDTLSLPIEAIWYHKNNWPPSDVIERAKNEQITYYNTTQKWIPVIAIDPDRPSEPFVFNEDDQGISQIKAISNSFINK